MAGREAPTYLGAKRPSQMARSAHDAGREAPIYLGAKRPIYFGYKIHKFDKCGRYEVSLLSFSLSLAATRNMDICDRTIKNNCTARSADNT